MVKKRIWLLKKKNFFQKNFFDEIDCKKTENGCEKVEIVRKTLIKFMEVSRKFSDWLKIRKKGVVKRFAKKGLLKYLPE